MGVGGGLLMVPALVLLAGFGQQAAAQGTSLLAIIPAAIAAAYRGHRSGFVRLRDALGLTLGGIVGVFLGSAGALNRSGAPPGRPFFVLRAPRSLWGLWDPRSDQGFRWPDRWRG